VDECAPYPRKSSGYKFVKRILVDKVDFANKTLNQVGKRRRCLSKKEQAKVRKTKIDYAYGSSDNQIKMLHGDLLHQQNYTGADKIIAIMDAGFWE
jgi:acetone carboxylase gamma subunit